MPTFLAMAKEMMEGKRAAAPIATLLGFRMTDIEEGRARFEILADERLANPMGTLHGGVLCDVADAAMGMAFASTLLENESFTTLELKINFIRPVWRALLVAEGTVVSRGKNVGMAECVITDDRGRIVAKASSTCMALRGEQASGR